MTKILKKNRKKEVFLKGVSVTAGGVHRGRDVCIEGKESACDTGRLWDGSGQSYEEGKWEKHVTQKAMEVIKIFNCISLPFKL